MVPSIAGIAVVLMLLVSAPQMVSTAPILEHRADVGQNDDSLISDVGSNSANDWLERKHPPPASVLDVDTTFKYTHGHGIVTNSFQKPLLISDAVIQHSALSDLVTEKPGLSLPPDGLQQPNDWHSTMSSPSWPSIQVDALPTKDQDELESTIDDLMSQLQTDLATGLVSTAGLLPDINFANAETDVVIVNPPLQIEAVEAEEDVVEEIQSNPVPVVSNLVNLLFPQSDINLPSATSSSSDTVSSGGIIGGSVSSTSIANPFALLFSYGLAAASVFALTLPLWVPFVVTKRRQSSAQLKKKINPLNKKKASQVPEIQIYRQPEIQTYKQPEIQINRHPEIKTYQQPEINHKQQQNSKFTNNDYDKSPVLKQPQNTGTTVAYRPAASPDYSSNNGLNLGSYSALFGNSFWSRSNDPLKDPGPLKSKGVYGPISKFLLKSARRHSNRRRPQKIKQ